MDRDGEHIGAAIEHALRAVAVMQVDIEDRDAVGRLCAGAVPRSPELLKKQKPPATSAKA